MVCNLWLVTDCRCWLDLDKVRNLPSKQGLPGSLINPAPLVRTILVAACRNFHLLREISKLLHIPKTLIGWLVAASWRRGLWLAGRRERLRWSMSALMRLTLESCELQSASWGWVKQGLLCQHQHHQVSNTVIRKYFNQTKNNWSVRGLSSLFFWAAKIVLWQHKISRLNIDSTLQISLIRILREWETQTLLVRRTTLLQVNINKSSLGSRSMVDR